jgi:hypothetical protein
MLIPLDRVLAPVCNRSARARILAAGLVLLLAGPAGVSHAQVRGKLNWAEKTLSDLKHDFGSVARGADASHIITVTNIYEEDLRLLHVGTTCGCTAAKPDKDLLKTGEVANIVVKMNTVKFQRQKNSNVDVTFSFTDKRGLTASKKVRIPISAYIRPDIVIEPGGVNFGLVESGAGAEQRVRVSYTGRSNWNIREVNTGNPYLSAEAVETSRQAGAVKYDLVVRVSPEAPLGVLRDKLVLKTADANVPVLVEAKVEPDIVVTPSVVTLGKLLKPGEEKTYTVVLKGRKPFVIEKIECNSKYECFKVRLSQERKIVHVLPLTFSPPEVSGQFDEEFTITVAGRPDPIVLKAQGTIVATTTSADTAD